jgi:hypothetical protein
MHRSSALALRRGEATDISILIAQLLVGALLCDGAVCSERDDVVGLGEAVYRVCDVQNGGVSTTQKTVLTHHRLKDVVLSRSIQTTQYVVDHDDGLAEVDCTSERNTLLLSTRQTKSLAADHRLVAFRHVADIDVEVAGLDDCAVPLGIELGAVDNVLAKGVVDQPCSLTAVGDFRLETSLYARCQRRFAEECFQESGFAAADGSDNHSQASFFDSEVHV